MGSLVSGLSFGRDEPGIAAAEWIQDGTFQSVRRELNRGTQVWLYRNATGAVVGFGSLGTIRWDFGGEYRKIQFIPMLGIVAGHQGLPKPDSGTPKYCHQLIAHLIAEAQVRASESSYLGLSVRPDNRRAIRLYERAGFVDVETENKRTKHMLVRLAS